MRKVIITAAAVIILIAAIYLYIVMSIGALPSESMIQGVVIYEKTQICGTESLTIDIRRPVISGLTDLRFQKDINSRIERQILDARKAAGEAASKFWRETKQQGYIPWPYVFYAEYEAGSVDVILSLKVTTLLYTGGPGMPATVCYNADIKKNKLITLSDLFRDNNYKEKIYRIVKDEMGKEPDRFFNAENFKQVTDKTKFFIRDGKLYITFAKYEVASGAAGEPEFLIPADAVRDSLREEYRGVFR